MTMETGYTGPGEFPWKTGDYYKESEVIKRVWSELEKMGAALQSVQGLMKPDVDLGPARDNIIDQLRKLAETQDWINEKLAGRMGRTEKKVDDLSTLDKATAHRIDHLENELRRVSENHTLQLDDSKRRASEIERRIEKLATGIRDVADQLNEAIREMRTGHDMFELKKVNEEPEPEFSPPVGGGISTENAQDFRNRIIGAKAMAKAMAQEQYDRGLSAGSERALSSAKHRVRTALVQMGWAPGSPSMEMVMKAIRG